MTDAKRLLAEATPLPWVRHGTTRIDSAVNGGYPIGRMDDNADAALIVYAVNHLPDYLAAVEALERMLSDIAIHGSHLTEAGCDEFGDAFVAARAALARLRDEVPA